MEEGKDDAVAAGAEEASPEQQVRPDGEEGEQYVIEGKATASADFLTPPIDVDLTESSKGAFSYKVVSDMSEITEESLPSGLVQATQEGTGDLANFDKLMAQTKDKMKILESQDADDATSVATSAKLENADEFLRNFFIKFGMKKTLDSFMQEWFELKAKGELDLAKMPHIPEIYRLNSELSDHLTELQQELDEARITAEKARSTYDKLRKQKDFQKINHRRVQQEKSKLNNDIGKLKKTYEQYQD